MMMNLGLSKQIFLQKYPEIMKVTDEINSLSYRDLNLDDSRNKSIKPASQLDRSLDDFDRNAGKSWIFPIGYEKREYQFRISQTCLFQNTLVCLPTGLGKTFIASVVIYNFYRWFPRSKIIFMVRNFLRKKFNIN
jgi:superfamily II DNA or RNA helicase